MSGAAITLAGAVLGVPVAIGISAFVTWGFSPDQWSAGGRAFFIWLVVSCAFIGALIGNLLASFRKEQR